MALSFSVEWLAPVYEAASPSDRSAGEWPPEPARAFCALVSVARSEHERDALRWLEVQEPPIVIHPPGVQGEVTPAAYVVTNEIPDKAREASHASYVARRAARDQRRWPRTFLAAPHSRFVWPDADPGADRLRLLDELARRIPYVGRATAAAMASFSDVDRSQVLGDEQSWHPVAQPAASGDRVLRVPRRGYVDDLVDAYEAGRPPHGLAALALYSGPPVAAAPPVAVGRYERLLVLGFPRGVHLDGTHAVAVTAALRRAVLNRSERHLHAIHGHHDGTVVQCAFIALPDVGHANATGVLRGVGLAIPRAMDPGDRSAVLRAVVGEPVTGSAGMTELAIPAVGRLDLVRERQEGRRTLNPDRWSGPSRSWASVFPVVLDRFPKRETDIDAAIRESCRFAGLPDSVLVEVRRRSAASGGVSLRPNQTVRREGDRHRLPNRHVVLTFDQPVLGPLVLGHMRHYGLGLCVPLDDGVR